MNIDTIFLKNRNFQQKENAISSTSSNFKFGKRILFIQNIYVYIYTQLSRGNELNVQNWGWKEHYGKLSPVITEKLQASDTLLKHKLYLRQNVWIKLQLSKSGIAMFGDMYTHSRSGHV